jgi:hypothetical protein
MEGKIAACHNDQVSANDVVATVMVVAGVMLLVFIIVLHAAIQLM